MKNIIVCLLLFTAASVKSQTYNAQLITGNDVGVTSYEFQKSIDNITFVTFASVLPTNKDTNTYNVTITGPVYYYRVKINPFNEYSDSLLVPAIVPVSNFAVVKGVASWTQTGTGVASFIISRSTNGNYYTVKKTVPSTGAGNYNVQVSGQKPANFKIVPVMTDGTQLTAVQYNVL